MDLRKIVGGLILVIGVFAFIISIFNNNLNFALIYLTTTLIFWVLYGLFMDLFDVKIFAGIISGSGFLVAISVLFLFGIEEVPYPVGAIVFHSIGFAGALGIGLFSLFPILILYQMDNPKKHQKIKVGQESSIKKSEPKIFSEEWEMATEDDLQSDEFDLG